MRLFIGAGSGLVVNIHKHEVSIARRGRSHQLAAPVLLARQKQLLRLQRFLQVYARKRGQRFRQVLFFFFGLVVFPVGLLVLFYTISSQAARDPKQLALLIGIPLVCFGVVVVLLMVCELRNLDKEARRVLLRYRERHPELDALVDAQHPE